MSVAESAGENGTPEAGPPDAAPSEAKAKDICLRLLTGRARTRAELHEAMLRKNVTEEVAERVLARLVKARLVDDAAFAESWVRSRHAQSGLSSGALVAELRRKGVDEEVAAEAAAEVRGAPEEQRARELVRKKLRSAAPPDGDDRRRALTRRLVSMLARKGYQQGLAYRVVRDELADTPGHPGSAFPDDLDPD